MSRNYAETLAYWYFRLNGFIPLTDLVLHDPHEGVRPQRGSADTDLLAVRFPFAYERIGGQPGYTSDDVRGDWDPKLRILELERNIVGLIVDVKAGRESHAGDINSFTPERIKIDVQRLGIVDGQELDEACRELSRSDRWCYRGDYCLLGENGEVRVAFPFTLAKVVISRNGLARAGWCNLTLKHVIQFIRQRMSHYRDHKQADFHLFPDDLIQFLIWH